MSQLRSGTSAAPRGPRPPAKADGSGLGRELVAAGGRFCRERPGVIGGIAVVLACGGAICWNALTQQAVRHPAPLFGTKGVASVEPPRRPDLTPQQWTAPIPVRRPDPVGLAAPAVAPDPQPARPAATDPIGAMIRASGGDPAPRPAGETARVAAAQKALLKLGYGPLKPDGQMGATTRQALERFERDQKLPVTRELGSRTIRPLASLSGLPID